MSDIQTNDPMTEQIVMLRRVSKVVQGGRRFSFAALVVVGDKAGSVGYGYGKADDLTEAIRKGGARARQSQIKVPMKKNTIPHEILCKFKSAHVLLKPAAPGTGIIAGGSVRIVMELCGVRDVLTKSLKSKNKINIVKAIFGGLEQLMNARQIAKNRDKTLQEMWN